MVPVESLIAFAVASIVLIAIPGPSVLFSVGRALVLGRVGGLLSVLGNALGLLPIIVAVALGVGAFVAKSAVLFTIIKIAGALYLVYLGIQAIGHRRAAGAALTGEVVRVSRWRQLGQGFVVGVTNPKTIAFFVAVLPQFVSLEAGSAVLQMLELGLVFFVLAIIGDSTWALAAGAARDWFVKSPKRAERLAGTGGVMMLGLGGILAFSSNA
ncbi:LysE family translocator [Agromyces larvae]|uniref:LysE family translocator n=1 Tax=Agromyces larvae TaxID=2929802 RepID=A0ABY4C0E2_9MICO|nr:LysE family translocator [Agromyces larvae]UOE43591.1 LysE family translocator [Agromyces larvae]